MNTYSHLLITAIARKPFQRRGIPVHTRAALLGSIMPDLPLFALTFGYWIVRASNPELVQEGIFGPTYDALYFTNPFWVISHNFFHAPLIIAAIVGLGYYGLRHSKAWGSALFWFGLACGLHSAIDIPTHGEDGPLLLFPFDWQLRFYSPISYWDPRYYGAYFSIFEHLLVLGILVYFGVSWLRTRRRLAQQPVVPEQCQG